MNERIQLYDSDIDIDFINELETLLEEKKSVFTIDDFYYHPKAIIFNLELDKGFFSCLFTQPNLEEIKMFLPHNERKFQAILDEIEKENYDSLFSFLIDKRDLINCYFLLFNDLNDEQKYIHFKQVYQRIEFQHDLFLAILNNELFHSQDRIYNKDKYEKYDENVIVYRGFNSKNNENGFSWTTNYDTAMFFAKRFGIKDNGNYILKGYVRPNDIILHIDERGENEVLISPKNVKIIEKIHI